MATDFPALATVPQPPPPADAGGVPPVPHWTRRRRLLQASLLLCHALLVLHCAAADFVTYDEVGNLTAGLAYLHDGTYGLYNVNPPLSKQLAALPVALARPDIGPIAFADVPGDRPEWDIGDQFARANSSRYTTLVFLGRLAGLGWSLLGALLICRWASELWGTSGGLLALALWCFEPNVIAHAHLMTADMPAAVAGLGAAYVYRRYLLAPSWLAAFLAGAALGIAQLCKFTLLILYPTWVVLWVLFFLVRRDRSAARGGVWVRVWQLVVLFAVSLVVLNLGYEGSGTGKRLEDYPFVSQMFAGPGENGAPYRGGAHGNRFRGSWLGKVIVPLPEAYVRGIDLQRRDFELYRTRPKFLAGEWSVHGWWHYYLYAAAVKIPLGTWGILLLALVWPWLGPCGSAPWRELALLWVPALALFTFVSSQRSLQHHFRYVFPVFPFVLVYAGRLGACWAQAPSPPPLSPAYRGEGSKTEAPLPCTRGRGVGVRGPRLLVLLLLTGAIASYLRVHPHSLAYFNELAGGPENGHNYLLGSNIDWGQDLFRLKRWMDDHPEARPLRLAYFNHIDPRMIGIDFELPPPGVSETPPADREQALRLGPQPGYYAVSVRLVRGNPATVADGQGGYEFAPFRAYEYFHRFAPVAKAGYSIFIYHITLEEANRVRRQVGLPPLPGDGSTGSLSPKGQAP